MPSFYLLCYKCKEGGAVLTGREGRTATLCGQTLARRGLGPLRTEEQRAVEGKGPCSESQRRNTCRPGGGLRKFSEYSPSRRDQTLENKSKNHKEKTGKGWIAKGTKPEKEMRWGGSYSGWQTVITTWPLYTAFTWECLKMQIKWVKNECNNDTNIRTVWAGWEWKADQLQNTEQNKHKKGTFLFPQEKATWRLKSLMAGGQDQ